MNPARTGVSLALLLAAMPCAATVPVFSDNTFLAADWTFVQVDTQGGTCQGVSPMSPACASDTTSGTCGCTTVTQVGSGGADAGPFRSVALTLGATTGYAQITSVQLWTGATVDPKHQPFSTLDYAE